MPRRARRARRNFRQTTTGTSTVVNAAEISAMLGKPPSDWKSEYRSGMKARSASGQGASRPMTLENVLKILEITAGGNVSGDRASGPNKVPQAVRDAAMKGVRLSYANNYGAWDFIGIARAIQLATQRGIPDKSMSRMRSYFSRHRKDKQSSGFGDDSNPSKGYMAWLNWGGEAGKQWVDGARNNPYEYLIPEGMTAKTAGAAKHAIVPGARRRLQRAGDVILPEGVVRFVFPEAGGRFRQQDIQPEAGVLKVLIDIGVSGPDKLTPMGLWHRFFQSHSELAHALPSKRRALRRPGIAVSISDVEIAKLTGGYDFPQPRTRWWRAGNKYLGSEDLYDAMAMAMAFPGGIVYGVRPTGFGPDALDAEHPPAVKAKLREYLRPIEQRDTDRVRRWVGEQARRGVVTLTSYDLLLGNNDALNSVTEDYLETGKIRPGYERRLQGISSILEEDRGGKFRQEFGLNPLPRSNPFNPTDPQGRHIPEKYLAGLPPHLRAQRIRELGESRDEYGTGDFTELDTDAIARKMGLVKLSAYRAVAIARGFDVSQVNSLEEMARKALRYYGAKATTAQVSKLAAGLKKVYGKGLAAWKSGGHRPGASSRNWADARVASVLVGGKAAWTADSKQFSMLPASARKRVVAQLPQLYSALKQQGRTRDISYIKSSAVANPRAQVNAKKGMSPAMRAFLRGEKTQRSRSEVDKMREVQEANERIARLMQERKEKQRQGKSQAVDPTRFLKKRLGKRKPRVQSGSRDYIKVVVRAIVPGEGMVTEEIFIYTPGKKPPKLDFRALVHNAFDVLNPEPRARAHAIVSTSRVLCPPADDPDAVFNVDLSQHTAP